MRRQDDLEDRAGWLIWLQGLLADRGYDVTSARSGDKTRFALDAGLAPATVTRILGGKAPDLEVQVTLSRFLGVSLDELLVRTGKAEETDFHHSMNESGHTAVSSETRLTPEELAVAAGFPREDREWFATMVRRLRKQADENGSAAGGAAAEG
ncbi:helix-turn-helix transcriptional regulator [Streptomyces zaomyceticus]|uniref:helix-turn-helix domain-containing protein n=1 Tax=Streptomyces zaomyceticus TaxID=68286 RepID=UPI002E0D7500|nr:helix-turn-helix transcriptional regulator [Streptomyces zaomyceticus]